MLQTLACTGSIEEKPCGLPASGADVHGLRDRQFSGARRQPGRYRHDNEQQPFIAAYDKKTGKLAWKKDRDVGTKAPTPARSGWVTPYVWRRADRTEIVTVGPGKAISYDIAGKVLWLMSGMSGGPVPMPFAYDGLLYINGGRGRPLYAIRPGASGDISLKEKERQTST
jgi:hypothetical protein